MGNHLDHFPRVRRRSPLYSFVVFVAIVAAAVVMVFSVISTVLPSEDSRIDLAGHTFQVESITDTGWSFFGYKTDCGWLQFRVFTVEGTFAEGGTRILRVCGGPAFIGATILEDVELARK